MDNTSESMTLDERILRAKSTYNISSIVELAKYASRDVIINLTLRSTSYKMFYQNQKDYSLLNITIDEVIDFLERTNKRFDEGDSCIDISYDLINAVIDFYCHILSKDVIDMIGSEINNFIAKRYLLFDACIDLLKYNEMEDKVLKKLVRLLTTSEDLLFKIASNIIVDVLSQGLVLLISECCKLSIKRLLVVDNIPIEYIVIVLNSGDYQLDDYECNSIIKYYILPCNRKKYNYIDLKQVTILLYDYLRTHPTTLISIRRNKIIELIENEELSYCLQKILLLNIPKNEVHDILMASNNWYYCFKSHEIVKFLESVPRSQLYTVLLMTINRISEEDMLIIIKHIKRLPTQYIIPFYILIKQNFPSLATQEYLLDIVNREYKRRRGINKEINKLWREKTINTGKKQHTK